MKRFPFLFSALMIGALLLAACGGGAQEQPPAGGTVAPGVTGTEPAGFGTAAPTVSVGETGTATVGVETSPTAAVGTTPVGTETAPAGGLATGTPTLSTGAIPGTGAGTLYVLLSELMAMPVNDQAGQQVGSLAGVVVHSPASGAAPTGPSTTGTPAATTDSSSAMTTQTPAATTDSSGGAGTTTGTPAATDTGAGAAMGNNPTIGYLVVDVSSGAGSGLATGTPAATETQDTGMGGETQTPDAGSGMGAGTTAGNQVLVPWQAFTFTPGSGASGAGGSTLTTETPAVGGTTETPAVDGMDVAGTGTPTAAADSSSGSGTTTDTQAGGELTLTVDQSVLAGAPPFDATSFTGTVSPDIAQYWSGQGLSIPATGGPTAGGSFLLQSPMTGLEVTDNSGQSLGQVQDFIVNTTTGELVYAVLSGGTTMGSNVYVVPFTAMTWQSGGQGAAAGASTMGQIQATVPSSAFTSAPSFTSLSELDLTSPDWQSEIDTYWSSVQ